MPAAIVDTHDPRWTGIGRRWTERLAGALADLESRDGTDPVVVEHIGSTAVPGLAAKPIIDLQVRVAPLPSEAALEAALGPLGFAIERGAPACTATSRARVPTRTRTCTASDCSPARASTASRP